KGKERKAKERKGKERKERKGKERKGKEEGRKWKEGREGGKKEGRKDKGKERKGKERKKERRKEAKERTKCQIRGGWAHAELELTVSWFAGQLKPYIKLAQPATGELADRRYRLTPKVDLKLFEPTLAVSANLCVQPDLVCPDLPCHCHSSPNVTLHQLSNTKINLCNQHSINADAEMDRADVQINRSTIKGWRGGDLIHVIAKGDVVGIGGGSFPAPY
ncbi:putative serine/threonine-protein kinase roco5, partial [Ophiophagus hannah]